MAYAFPPADTLTVSEPSVESRVSTPMEASLMLKPVVALLSDDEAMRSTLRQGLDLLGYASVAFSSGAALLEAINQGLHLNLVLLASKSAEGADRQLVQLRAVSSIPVVMVIPGAGAHDAGRHVRRWMQEGGEIDFIVGEASHWELECRVQALLGDSNSDISVPSLFAAHDRLSPAGEGGVDRYVFLEGQPIVLLDEREIVLKQREFDLAHVLFRSIGKVLSREWLWRTVWGMKSTPPRSRAIDVCVANVRRKLELRPCHGVVLTAIYGRGYRLSRVSQADAREAGEASSRFGGMQAVAEEQ